MSATWIGLVIGCPALGIATLVVVAHYRREWIRARTLRGLCFHKSRVTACKRDAVQYVYIRRSGRRTEMADKRRSSRNIVQVGCARARAESVVSTKELPSSHDSPGFDSRPDTKCRTHLD